MTRLTPVVAMTPDGDYAACQSDLGSVRVVGLGPDDVDVTLRARHGRLRVVGFRPGRPVELLIIDCGHRGDPTCGLLIWAPESGFTALPGRYPISATVTWSVEGDCVVVDATAAEAAVDTAVDTAVGAVTLDGPSTSTPTVGTVQTPLQAESAA